MTMAAILLFWVLLGAAFVARGTYIFYLFFAMMPFGSFAVLPTALTGGLTVIAAPVVALAIVVRTLGSRAGSEFAVTSALMPRRLALLFGFWLVAVVTTLFMPRLFFRDIEVIPMRGILSRPELLHPTPQNISQLGYLTVSVFMVFALARLLRNPRMRQSVLAAMCFGAAMVVLTGVLDFATQFFPIEPLLQPFRTATYSLAVGVEVLEGKRVVGLMPEASAFGSICLSFLTALYFLRRSIGDERLRELVVPVLIGALILLIWLAKSTGAYVGFALFGGFAGIEWTWRATAVRRGSPLRRGLAQEFWIALATVMGIILVILLDRSVLDPIIAIIDRMVLEKTSSHSWEERGMWRMVAWNAFLDSYGLGVGVGATRSSSAHVGLLSNVGILGALLYYAFTIQTLTRRAARGDRLGAAMINAVRWSFLPPFVVGLFNGSIDFGLFNAFLFALATGVALGAPRTTRTIPRSIAPAPAQAVATTAPGAGSSLQRRSPSEPP